MPIPDADRECVHCACTVTPLWRRSPLGPKTLCNACGVRMKKGRLVFDPNTASFVTVESPAAAAKRQRKEREAQNLLHPRDPRRPLVGVASPPVPPALSRPHNIPVPAHAAHVLHPIAQPVSPNQVQHTAGVHIPVRQGAIAKTASAALCKNRKSFKGPTGLYYLLAAIEFVETS